MPLTRTPPALPYNGITILLSHAGRFDDKQLISGPAGVVFDELLRRSKTSRFNCDIRTLQCGESLLQGTRVLLLCGTETMERYFGTTASLDEIRGYPRKIGEHITLATYHPQDIVDRKDYEKTLNKEALDYSGADDSNSESAASESDADTKAHGKTKRKNWKFWFSRDVEKAVRLSRTGIQQNKCVIISAPPLHEAVNELSNWKQGIAFFDIETNPATNQIVCFSFGNAQYVMAIPIIDQNQQLFYGMEGTAAIFQSLAKLFRDNTIVIHNSQFDLFILLWKYKIPPPPQYQIQDTMLMQHRLYPEVEKSLGHIVSLYTDEPYHKNTAGTWTPHNRQQLDALLHYNAKDVETMALCHKAMLSISAERNCQDSFKQANESIRPYLLLSFRGLLLDNTSLCNHIDELTKKIDWFEFNVMDKLVGHPLNPRSWQQVAKYLYDELGLKKPSTDLTASPTLFKILTKHDIPAIKLILGLRGLGIRRSKLEFVQWNGRATCTYVISGTDTLRLSSRAILKQKNKKDSGWGTNMQNWEKELRKEIIPDGDNVFVQVDQSGAEALVVAYLCKHGMFRDLFLNGIKSHVFVALHVFNKQLGAKLGYDISDMLKLGPSELRKHEKWKPVERIIKDSDNWSAKERYYFIAKMICHASNYGMKAPTFCLNVLEKSEGQINLSLMEASTFLNTYHGLFPEIKQWHESIKQELLSNNGILRNLFGYPRMFTSGSFHDDQTLKTAYAFKPQSTVGTITNICLSSMQARLDSGVDKRYLVMQNNHDSGLLQTSMLDMLDVSRLMINEMCKTEFTSPVDGAKFFMKAEAQWGNDWKDMKEVHLVKW